MAIEVTSTINSSSATNKVSNSNSTDTSKKTTTDSSFKDEMEKVVTKDVKKDSKAEDKKTETKSAIETENKVSTQKTKDKKNLETEIDYAQYGSMALLEAGNQLNGDIEKMFNINGINSYNQNINPTDKLTFNAGISIFGENSPSKISMTQSDAEFFVDLTQNKEINVQNITVQAQNMLNNGANVAEVKQNVQISQTLLDAINKAKETNQPLRIDFDKNVSVILRIGKDGAIAANFIPGDKAVEQYLRNNIEQLKTTFNEQDLPYKELTYSQNRGKNNQRRNNKQQGGDK